MGGTGGEERGGKGRGEEGGTGRGGKGGIALPLSEILNTPLIKMLFRANVCDVVRGIPFSNHPVL